MDETIILATPCTVPAHTDEAQVRKCCECGQDVWAAPSSVAFEATRPVKYMCLACAPSPDELPDELTLPPGSTGELEKMLGTWGTTLLKRRFNVQEIE